MKELKLWYGDWKLEAIGKVVNGFCDRNDQRL